MAQLKVYAVLTAKEGKEQQLETLLKGMVAPSRAEAGNLRYDLWQDTSTVGRFLLDELYWDEEANSAHRASTHFQNYAQEVEHLADRLVLVVRAIDVDTSVNGKPTRAR